MLRNVHCLDLVFESSNQIISRFVRRDHIVLEYCFICRSVTNTFVRSVLRGSSSDSDCCCQFTLSFRLLHV